MKKLLITLALVATTAAAFAQGKILLGNDAAHLVTIGGTPIPQVGGWSQLTLQLMGGTSAGSLVVQTTIVGDLNANVGLVDGRFANRNFTMVGVAGGATAFLQILIFDTAAGSFAAASAPASGFRYGSTDIFTVVTGSFANNPITAHIAPSLSTWADGPVVVNPVPEPSSMALAGLGAASLLIFRRRK